MSESPGKLPVSIIITSYNYARYIALTIESAYEQTYAPVEVIVVDDGSTDDSANVIASHPARPRFIAKRNGGQASAMNAGFAASQGELILFLDSDDLLLPNAVEQAVRHFDPARDAKVHWPLIQVDGDGQGGSLVPLRRPLGRGDVRDEVIAHGPDAYGWPPTSANAWSRRFLERVLPIPEAEYVTCPDSYLASLAPVYGNIALCETPLTKYRVHPNNSMGKVRLSEQIQRFEHCCEMLAMHLRWQGVDPDPARWLGEDPTYGALRRQQREMAAWHAELARTAREIVATTPEASTLILVDENQWPAEVALPRRTLPFLERDGLYWGTPPDDGAATAELDRMVDQHGATHIAFLAPAFWWLTHYTEFAQHVQMRGRCLLDNDRVKMFAFDDRSPAAPSS